MQDIDYEQFRRKLQEIQELARKAELDLLSKPETLHPKDPNKICKSVEIRVDVKMEDGSGFVRCFTMNPHAVQISQRRDIDREAHRPKGPAYLTITGQFGDCSNEPQRR